LYEFGVRGDQRTLSSTQLISDLPQLSRHPAYAVLDFGEEATSPVQRLAKLGLGNPRCGAHAGQLRTQL
jgi:hypothetical protein